MKRAYQKTARGSAREINGDFKAMGLRLLSNVGSENMKLSKCILAFEKGISESNRPEDRNLAVTYLSVLAPLLAEVIEQHPLGDDIENIERLIGQFWIIDVDPFQTAFNLWEQSKKELKQNNPNN